MTCTWHTYVPHLSNRETRDCSSRSNSNNALVMIRASAIAAGRRLLASSSSSSAPATTCVAAFSSIFTRAFVGRGSSSSSSSRCRSVQHLSSHHTAGCSSSRYSCCCHTHHRHRHNRLFSTQHHPSGTSSAPHAPPFAHLPVLTKHALGPARTVPEDIPRPLYLQFPDKPVQRVDDGVAKALSPASDMVHMRRACKVASIAREIGGEMCRAGNTTDMIDAAVHDAIIAMNAYPSALGYMGFPKSVCTSVNQVICHGVPDTRVLQVGDVVNIDVVAYADGYHGDCSATFIVEAEQDHVGVVDGVARHLVDSVQRCLDAGIGACRDGAPLRTIGWHINECADAIAGVSAGGSGGGAGAPQQYGLVRHFIGHGIGQHIHCPPMIVHYRNGMSGDMATGMVFTIEPALTEGGIAHRVWDDKWTVVTEDGGRSVQWEETVVVTDDGCEILTQHTAEEREHMLGERARVTSS